MMQPAMAMSPDRSASGRPSNVVFGRLDTPLGPMVAGANDDGLCFLEYTDPVRLEAQKRVLARLFGEARRGRHSHVDRVAEELARYFAGTLREFTVPLVVPGTAFEQSVWRLLQAIPYGDTRSYVDLARDLGSPGAARAVGSANGRNRIAIVIPCHRVVNAGGSLGGYGGGLWRKQRLLDLERGVRGLPLG